MSLPSLITRRLFPSFLLVGCFNVHCVFPWSSLVMPTRRSQVSETSMKEIDTEERDVPTWCPEQQIYIGGIVPDNSEVEALLSENGGQLRIFGYGSLCWNPGQGAVLSSPGVTTTLGRARGYKRCWAQRSADHRGTPDFPGIVCTLLRDDEVHQIKKEAHDRSEPPSMTEGLIYTVPPELVDDCLSELDFREKGGYARDVIDVVQDDTGKSVKALLYRGTPDNPAFWKRALLDLPFAAATMAQAIGPSGKNDEYLFKLDHFLSDAVATSQAAAAALVDHTGDSDTGSLASMARSFQQKQLFFLFGSGSNQHNQLLLGDSSSTSNGASLVNGDEAHELTEIVLVTPIAAEIEKPKQLFAGGGHSGLLTGCGTLYLWGWNQNGQLGRKLENEESSPIQTIEALKGIKVEAAAFGHAHTLVIELGTGFLYAFGDNGRGQVSEQMEQSTISEPVKPFSENCFIAVAAGLFHSAAITEEGDLVTFGCGKFGQSLLREIEKWRPHDDSRLVGVACGRRHTVLLDDRGRIWTMGENKYGQLGRDLPSSTNGKWDSEPRLVEGILGSGDCEHFKVACGWSHTIVTVKAKSGVTEIYGWGRNDKGQLGTGSRSSVHIPTKLFSDESRIRKVACGSEFTMVMDESDKIFACGWNEHGNLSAGHTEDVLELTEIKGARVTAPPSLDGTGEKLFAAGGAHFLAMIS